MPIFTLDTNPVQEADGKFTVNIPDEMAVEASKYADLNTKHTTLTGQFTEANTKLQGLDGITRESFDVMKTKLEAFNNVGDPEKMALDLATANNNYQTLQGELESLKGKNSDLTNFQRNTVIGKEIANEMKSLIGDEASQYSGVYKMFVADFELNSDNEARTKEGFTVKQFLENKAKQPGFEFMKGRTNAGAGKTHDNSGGGSEKDRLQKEFNTLGKEEQTPRVAQRRYEIAMKLKSLDK